MRVMSAGEGYRYLLNSVVAGDGNRALGTPLADYYTAQGTPPGFWLGSGIADLGDGQLRPGGVVSEAQLRLLLGHGRDPLTGEALGRAYPNYPTRAERVRTRVDALDPELSELEHAAAVVATEVEEADRPTRRAVAGYDYTFSVPKSVSVLWALADPDTQAKVVAAHHAAIADVIGLMEREVAATRTGSTATDGAVAQVEVAGLIATAYDHYDSRAGDPQLHTHVVISNKVKTVWDGKWRSLDSRPMHAATVAMSEHYNAVLADHLTAELGVDWERRARGRDRNPGWEIASIPDPLIETFSSRSADIDVEKDRLIANYVDRHGHRPAATTMIKLRQQATLATRPDKTVRSLADLTAQWRERAAVVGRSPGGLGGHVEPGTTRQPVVTSDVPNAVVERIARQVVAVVGEKRSTWRRWNLHAEASRQTIGLRFATTRDREALVDRVVDAAEGVSLRLTPPDLAAVPATFTRADGTSMFRPKHSTVFTSAELLDAEDRLLNLGRQTTGPTVPLRNLELAATMAGQDGHTLGEDQVAALTSVGTSGQVVDVLVGPAGAGKTTAMHALRNAWELSHGPHTVIGLAPSSAAAEVLAADLQIATENTAKWSHDHQAERTELRDGQLVIIDEASLAGTRTLDRITSHAAEVGAKVLLVGDWAQLAAVEAGGAFGMLVRDRTNPPELGDVHRFNHDWEKQASLQLRHGDTNVVDTYQSHDRIREGDTDTMIDSVLQAWRDDVTAGRSSLMIAQTRDIVAALNSRARDGRIAAGHTDPARAVRLHDHTLASTGDTIVTRHNNRRLQTGRGWVKNGDRWTITAINDDASLTVSRTGGRGPSVRLPAEYVTGHVELGYAVTAHRAQGATVDTAHAVVQPGMTRETLYVAMTRGRHANTAYITTDRPDHEAHHSPSAATGRSILANVLQHVGADRSAHEILAAQHDRWSTIAQLAAEYDTIAAAAQHDRWANLIHRSGLTGRQAEDVIGSDAFGPLAAELRRAGATHIDVAQLLPRLVAARPLGDVDDIAAILRHRLEVAVQRTRISPKARVPRLIAGLIVEATGPMSPEMRHALAERKHLIEQRAQALAERAIANREPWTRVGPNSAASASRETDASRSRIAAAYARRLSMLDHRPSTSSERRSDGRPTRPSM
ncbi:MAG: MobF family relaxase [Euzebya sp.]